MASDQKRFYVDSAAIVTRLYHHSADLFHVSGRSCGTDAQVPRVQPHPAWTGTLLHPYVRHSVPWEDVCCNMEVVVRKLDENRKDSSKRVVDIPGGLPQQKGTKEYTPAKCLSWTPSGAKLLTLHESGSCGIWEAATLHFADISTLTEKPTYSCSIAMMTEQQFLRGDSDGAIYISSLKAVISGKEAKEAHRGKVNSISRSPDVMFVSGGDDGIIRFTDVRRMDAGTCLPCGPSSAPVRAVDWNPVSSLVLSASDDGIVRLWDARSGVRCADICPSYKDGFIPLDLSSSTSDLPLSFPPSTGSLPTSTIATSTGTATTTVTGATGSAAGIAGAPTSNELTSQGSAPRTSATRAVKWNPNGMLFAYGGDSCSITVCDVRKMEEALQVLRHETKKVSCIAWHPFHERLLSSGTDEGYLFHWFLGYDDPVAKLPVQGGCPLNGLAYHPTGHTLATISDRKDMGLRFWSRPLPGIEINKSVNDTNPSAPHTSYIPGTSLAPVSAK